MSKELSTADALGEEQPASAASAGSPATEDVSAGAGKDAKKRKKQRRGRVRGAWIAFVGRIVAQFVGSVASIVLGLALIERHHAAVTAAQATPPPVSAAAPLAAPEATPGVSGPTLVVLPLDSFSGANGEVLVQQLAAAIRAAAGENASVTVISRNAPTRVRGSRRLPPQTTSSSNGDHRDGGPVAPLAQVVSR